MGPAWLGLVVAWVGWNVISTYWPVQATRLAFPASVKGLVEFAQALTQSLAALCLVYLGPWHHRPQWLLLFGACGLGGVYIFGGTAGPFFFVLGAVLYGIYTSSAFSNMVYHSMFEADKAVKRVSLNETFVGLSFLIGPVVAGLLHGEGEVFGRAYGLLAGVLAAGVVAQSIWARLLLRQDGNKA